MKNLKTFTIIIGFATGIILSMFIGDVIDFSRRRINSFRAAMHIKEAEQLAAARRFAEASALYDTVLRDVSENTQPRLYGRIRTSQGLTLASLAAQTKDSNDIIRAIRAFEQSLAVYQPDRDPEAYGAAQNNIGMLYLQLAEVHHRREYLRGAVSAFDESLRVFTPDKHPKNRALAEANRRKAVEEERALEEQRRPR